MKDTFYFTHDYNARQDEKIKELLMRHGFLGYGIFWAIIEDLYNNTNELRTNYERIAFELRTNEMVVKSIINDFGLFVVDGDYFGSLSVEKRLNERNEKSRKARESVLSRWNKAKQDTNVLRSEYDGNTIKERKEKERKENIEIPSLDLFIENAKVVCKANNIPFIEYEFAIKSKYQTWVDNGWKDGFNKPIKNWKNKFNNTLPNLKPIKNNAPNTPQTAGLRPLLNQPNP